MANEYDKPDLVNLTWLAEAGTAAQIAASPASRSHRQADAQPRGRIVEPLLAGIFEMMRVQQGTLTDIRDVLADLRDNLDGSVGSLVSGVARHYAVIDGIDSRLAQLVDLFPDQEERDRLFKRGPEFGFPGEADVFDNIAGMLQTIAANTAPQQEVTGTTVFPPIDINDAQAAILGAGPAGIDRTSGEKLWRGEPMTRGPKLLAMVWRGMHDNDLAESELGARIATDPAFLEAKMHVDTISEGRDPWWRLQPGQAIVRLDEGKVTLYADKELAIKCLPFADLQWVDQKPEPEDETVIDPRPFLDRWKTDHSARPTTEEGPQYVVMTRSQHTTADMLLRFAREHGCEAAIVDGVVRVISTDRGRTGIYRDCSLVIIYEPGRVTREVFVMSAIGLENLKAKAGSRRIEHVSGEASVPAQPVAAANPGPIATPQQVVALEKLPVMNHHNCSHEPWGDMVPMPQGWVCAACNEVWPYRATELDALDAHRPIAEEVADARTAHDTARQTGAARSGQEAALPAQRHVMGEEMQAGIRESLTPLSRTIAKQQRDLDVEQLATALWVKRPGRVVSFSALPVGTVELMRLYARIALDFCTTSAATLQATRDAAIKKDRDAIRTRLAAAIGKATTDAAHQEGMDFHSIGRLDGLRHALRIFEGEA